MSFCSPPLAFLALLTIAATVAAVAAAVATPQHDDAVSEVGGGILFRQWRRQHEQDKQQQQRLNRHSDKLSPGNICDLRVTVDNLLFRRWGKDLDETKSTTLAMVDRANLIFRHFGPLLREEMPIQFRVKELFVATDEFCSDAAVFDGLESSPDVRCSQCEYFPSQKFAENFILLENSSSSSSGGNFCLSFLLTGKNMVNAQGVAVMSGACVEDLPLNIGIVSAKGNSSLDKDGLDRDGFVLAHELAHSFGADHDDQGEGAVFVMNPELPETIT